MQSINDLARLKLYIGAALAAAAAGLQVLHYDAAATSVTTIGLALLGALGLNALGQGIGKASDPAPAPVTAEQILQTLMARNQGFVPASVNPATVTSTIGAKP